MITRETIKDMVGDKFFTVEFLKKDGELRRMNCRLGVKKHLKGGRDNVVHIPTLLPVYDLKAKGYRNINLKTLLNITVDGVFYTINPKWRNDNE